MELKSEEKLEAAVSDLRKCEGRSLAGLFALEVMHEVCNPLEKIAQLNGNGPHLLNPLTPPTPTPAHMMLF